MKRFFVLAVICAIGYFLAPQVLGIKTRSGNEYVNKCTYQHEAKAVYEMRPSENRSAVPVSTITMILDLEMLEQVKEPTSLISLQGNHAQFGLSVTQKGIVGTWTGKLWKPQQILPVSALLDNPNVLHFKGKDVLTLTMLVSGSTDPDDRTPGITLVDCSGDVVMSWPGLNSYYNKRYNSITVNDMLVSHVSVLPKLLSVRGAGKRGHYLEKTVCVKPGNAMLAYGGGGLALLLLVALWARLCPERRR